MRRKAVEYDLSAISVCTGTTTRYHTAVYAQTTQNNDTDQLITWFDTHSVRSTQCTFCRSSLPDLVELLRDHGELLYFDDFDDELFCSNGSVLFYQLHNSMLGSSCLEGFKWVAQEHPMYDVYFDNVSVLIACVKC